MFVHSRLLVHHLLLLVLHLLELLLLLLLLGNGMLHLSLLMVLVLLHLHLLHRLLHTELDLVPSYLLLQVLLQLFQVVLLEKPWSHTLVDLFHDGRGPKVFHEINRALYLSIFQFSLLLRVVLGDPLLPVELFEEL